MKQTYKRIKNTIKETTPTLVVTIIFNTLNYTINHLTQTNLQNSELVLQTTTFIYLTYFIYKFVNLTHKENLKQKNKKLETKLTKLQEKIQKERTEINDYFITWVHQIKTPITVIKLLLNNSNENHTLKIKTENELKRIDQYVSNALNYIKLIDNDKNMDFTQTNLNNILIPIFKNYSTLFIENNVELEYENQDTQIITDPNWCSILIEQIISNSIKYTKNGVVKIKFNEETNSLLIKDNGIGIPKDDVPKIFNRGYSGFNGRLNEKSTGIGLFIAKKIANRLNITLKLESEYKKGTQVLLTFPVRK